MYISNFWPGPNPPQRIDLSVTLSYSCVLGTLTSPCRKRMYFSTNAVSAASCRELLSLAMAESAELVWLAGLAPPSIEASGERRLSEVSTRFTG